MKMMRFIYTLFFIFKICPLVALTAFTNGVDGGRLGDNLLNLIKTYYCSIVHNVPMVLTPFPYSDKFKFSQILSLCSPKFFSRKASITGGEDWRNSKPIGALSSDTLYTMSYYYLPKGFRHLCQIDAWDDLTKDKKFLSTLREFLSVTTSYNMIDIPVDRISVAVHIRKGSGGDLGWFKGRTKKEGKRLQRIDYPEKFSPNSFYRNAIRQLYYLYNKPLYIHIFTDHPSPQTVATKLGKSLEGLDIVFGFKNESNLAEGDGMISDFVNMMRFDCLIRSKSNFGQVAELCKNYEVVIYPEHTTWINDKFIVDKQVTKFYYSD